MSRGDTKRITRQVHKLGFGLTKKRIGNGPTLFQIHGAGVEIGKLWDEGIRFENADPDSDYMWYSREDSLRLLEILTDRN